MTGGRPTPEEAAEALKQVEQREEQALGAPATDALWVRIVLGVAMGAYFASFDFLGGDVSTWAGFAFALVMVAYAVSLRTRRGSSALGRTARVDRKALARRSGYGFWLPLAVVAVGGVAAGFAGEYVTVPYWHTGLGVVLAVAVIFFAPGLERAMASLSGRGPRRTGSVRP